MTALLPDGDNDADTDLSTMLIASCTHSDCNNLELLYLPPHCLKRGDASLVGNHCDIPKSQLMSHSTSQVS